MTEKAKTVLLVEDQPEIAKVVRIRLEISGFKVIYAADGEECIDLARNQNPDIIVLDLMLPKIDGFQVCRMLKFDDEHKHIPIIVLSALHDQSERDKAIESGADACFLKPFDLNLLTIKIDELLNNQN